MPLTPGQTTPGPHRLGPLGVTPYGEDVYRMVLGGPGQRVGQLGWKEPSTSRSRGRPGCRYGRRRRISALMAELGATSRFGAGVEAARRGWL